MLNRIIWLLAVTALAGWGFSRISPAGPKTVPYHYPEQLPGAYTGGFGEQTCHSCHFDFPLNYEEGNLSLSGIPRTYRAGQQYIFTITVHRKNLSKAGFQVSARFRDSTQAGQFFVNNENIQFTTPNDSLLQYLQHTAAGTDPVLPDEHSWSFQWQAPKRDLNTVIFNISANAANGDASEFGDYIYSDTVRALPVQ